jgi:quercetin dioxygenase-like cupin family protein
MIAPAEALPLASLITPTTDGIASRILAKTSGGNLTLFAFDAGQGLSEHTSPFEALVIVLEGTCTLTIGGTPVRATPGTIVRMPADIPHVVDAVEATRFLLVMLRDPVGRGSRSSPGQRLVGRGSRSSPGVQPGANAS